MKKVLKECWLKVIQKYFNKGLIAYERQLQAYLFHELNMALPDYITWVEPTIYLDKRYTIDGKMPDMVLTNNNDEICTIIELKCKPWDSVQYQHDLDKLKEFEKLILKKAKIPLSWPPISSDWIIQLSTGGEKSYHFKHDCLLVFGVIAHPDAKAVSELKPDIKNFLHLKHNI